MKKKIYDYEGRIKRLRSEKDLTQEQLAELVGEETCAQTISYYENRNPRYPISQKKGVALAAALGVDPEYILYESDVPNLEQQKIIDKQLEQCRKDGIEKLLLSRGYTIKVANNAFTMIERSSDNNVFTLYNHEIDQLVGDLLTIIESRCLHGGIADE